MMTKTYITKLLDKTVRWSLPLCLAVLPLNGSAQIVVDDDDDDDEIEVVDEMGNKEEIDFPEAMTYDMDSLMSQYMSKTYLATDNDCQMKNENVTYDKQVYIDRLHRMPTIMEMPYNEVVQSCIDRYTSRMRQSVSYFLGASNFYMPIFEEALDLYQLPLELKYLPVIESALNPTAVSRVGATGLWQFMLTTGKAYGLNVNTLVDERRDPIKASYAAAHLLSDLYKVFGDWNLVIAAYNCGPGNVSKAIQRSGGSKDYWHIYPYLPRETRGYVPAFIAANYMMTYYSLHNICPMTSRLPAQTDTVMVTKKIHLEQIANVLDIDIEMLRALNPMYRHDIIPGNSEPYALRLPLADVNRFIENQDAICNYRASELLTNRIQVEVNDYTPTYYHKSKRSYKKGRKGRFGRHSKARRGGKRGAVRNKARGGKGKKSKGRKSRRRRR